MKAHPVGTIVKSRFDAPWTGVVVASGRDHSFKKSYKLGHHQLFDSIAVDRDNNKIEVTHDLQKGWVGPANKPWVFLSSPTNVLVKVTHDRCGQPMRKPLWMVLDSPWLIPV